MSNEYDEFNSWKGSRFCKWLVIGDSFKKSKSGHKYVLCRCSCDRHTERHVRCSVLIRMKSLSCGCIANKKTSIRMTRHGKTNTPEHKIWISMRQRCNDKNCRSFINYGARGIKVCKRWEKFENFLTDMVVRPKGTSIDRIDNNGNYFPDNCRWATREEQQSNRRNTRYISFCGITKPASVWAKQIGITRGALYTRLRIWPIDKALTEQPTPGH